MNILKITIKMQLLLLHIITVMNKFCNHSIFLWTKYLDRGHCNKFERKIIYLWIINYILFQLCGIRYVIFSTEINESYLLLKSKHFMLNVSQISVWN